MPLSPSVADLSPYDLLLSVAKLGSLGRAATEHDVSQPAASMRLRQLERRLGMALLERSPRGSRLTPEGALVADWARAAVDAASALDAGVASLRATRDSRLRVTASLTVAEYLLPRWLATLRRTEPDLAVALTAGNSDEVAQAVLHGAADLGFVEGPNLPEGLRARTVARDTLSVIVSPEHRWAGRRSLTTRELSESALISREEGSGTRRYLEQALRRHGLELAPPLTELSSTTAIKSAVVAGIGPAVLSSLAIATELASGTLVQVPVSGLDVTRRLRLVHPTGRPLTGPARDLATIAAR